MVSISAAVCSGRTRRHRRLGERLAEAREDDAHPLRQKAL
jgi:hypothetical protein